MPRRCTVCAHPYRAEIEQAILQGHSFRRIASQYDGISEASLRRHRAHITSLLQKHEEELADDIVARIRELNRIARETLEDARRERRYASVAALIGSALRALELEARLLGGLQDGKVQVGVQVNIEGTVMVPMAALEAIRRAVLDAPDEVRERIALALAEVARAREE